MARLVLLSFANNAEAERFVREMEPGTATDEYPETIGEAVWHATVEWVVARPTNPCNCAMAPAGSDARKRRRRLSRTSRDAFTKGKRFGWWLHAACKRPTRLVIEKFATNMTNGAYDLMPEIIGDGREPNDLRRYPGGDTWENIRTRR